MNIEHVLMWGFGFVGGMAIFGIQVDSTPRQSRRRGSNPPPPNKKPPFPSARIIGPDGETIGYRSINYPDPSPDRRPTNPFSGERIPNSTPTQAMNNPPLDEQNCDNCRYKRHRRGEDLCCINPPRLGDSGMMPICPMSRWCGEWVAR